MLITLDLGSQYSPLYGDIEENILSWIPQFSVVSNVLVCGDFNVSLKTIAYTRDDDRAETLLEYLTPSWLSIMNDPHAMFTFVQGDRTGRPNLTLRGDKIVAVWIHTCEVDAQNYSSSYHRYIKYLFKLSPIIRTRIRYKTKNKNFGRFNKIFGDHVSELLAVLLRVHSPESLETWMTYFYQYLNDSMNASFRKGSMPQSKAITVICRLKTCAQ